LPDHIIDIEKVVGVFTSIPEHFIGEWSHPPICKLVLLVCDHVTIVLEEES
jgi:hypothetical protein